MKNLRPVLLIGVIILSLHAILLANKTYECLGREFRDKDQYLLFIKSVENDVRDSYVTDTKITYFNVLPEWSPNVFYGAELLILILVLISPGKSKTEAIEQIKDLMLEVRIARRANN